MALTNFISHTFAMKCFYKMPKIEQTWDAKFEQASVENAWMTYSLNQAQASQADGGI